MRDALIDIDLGVRETPAGPISPFMVADLAWPTVCHLRPTQEIVMNWDTLKGQWKQVKGKLKEKWGKLTDDDLDVINGKKDQLVGKLQQHYGYAKDQAEKEVDEFCRAC
jgi:uncharacterized protein YjbJ (UPF0337 family)